MTRGNENWKISVTDERESIPSLLPSHPHSSPPALSEPSSVLWFNAILVLRALSGRCIFLHQLRSTPLPSQNPSPGKRRVLLVLSATLGFELEPKLPKFWCVVVVVGWSLSEWFHDGYAHPLRLENWEEKVEINESPLPWKLVFNRLC